MEQQEKIAVLIPCYNEEQQFQQSLQTLNENYQKQIFMSMIIIRPIEHTNWPFKVEQS